MPSNEQRAGRHPRRGAPALRSSRGPSPDDPRSPPSGPGPDPCAGGSWVLCCCSTITAHTHEFKAIHSQGRRLGRFVAGVHGEYRECYLIETSRTGPKIHYQSAGDEGDRQITGTDVPVCGILVRVSQSVSNHESRTSLADYRTALTTRAARRPAVASVLARLPIAMIGISA